MARGRTARVRKSVEQGLGFRRATTLREGVLAVFPFSDGEALVAWEQRVRDEAKRAPDPLLFIALVCGTQFRVFHVEARPVLEELREWLTSPPRRMRPDLAEVLIDALAPRIGAVLEERGWRAGPAGRPIEVKGRPPETPGSWASGVLVERYLQRETIDPDQARRLAVGLVSALSGREVASRQFSTARQSATNPETVRLVEAMTQAYLALVVRESERRLREPASLADRRSYLKWRDNFKGLRDTLAVSGADAVACEVLASIPLDWWSALGVRPKTLLSSKGPAL